jgi:hypothetical protein
MAYFKDRISCPGLIKKLSREYPNIDNRNLPNMVGCVSMQEESEAKEGFRRICFKDVRIASVTAHRNNRIPSCFWQVLYELKNPTTELDDDTNDSNSSGPVPLKLPDDQWSLHKLYEDITAVADFLGVKVVRKYHTENRFHAVVEYSPRQCQCTCQDFSGGLVAEEPLLRSDVVAKVAMNLYAMKLDM